MGYASLTDAATGKTYRLDGETSVGRNSDNKIVLEHMTVSGHHAVIAEVRGHWHIYDKNSSNGVVVNRFRIPGGGRYELQEGDRIRLGTVELRFSTTPEAAKAAESGEPAGKEKNRGKLYGILSAAVILAAVLLWCLGNHIVGGREQAAQNYDSAISSYRKDFLFSRAKRTETELLAGEAAYAREEYEKAAAYFLAAGEAGKLRRSDAIYARGEILFAAGEYDELKALLSEIAEETRAQLLSGEAAYAQGNYEAAMVYFQSAGETGKARWSDAVYARGKELIAAGEYDGAITLLSEISAEERAQEQIGVAELEEARLLFDEGKTEEAIKKARSIRNRTCADVVGFLDGVYHTVGDGLFLDKNLQGAYDAYNKCEKDTRAQTMVEILDKLRKSECYEAAVLVDQGIKDGSLDFSRAVWTDAFSSAAKTSPSQEPDALLNAEAAKLLVSAHTETERDAIRESVSNLTCMVNGGNIDFYGSGISLFPIDDLNALYAQCGKDPKGKILAIMKWKNYDGTTEQKLYLGMMRKFSADRFPASLAEVEYIIVVDYNFMNYGQYEHVTVALQEYGSLSVLRAPDRRSLYNSGTLYGDRPPNSFTYYVSPPAWKSGGAPDLSEKILPALDAIEKYKK